MSNLEDSNLERFKKDSKKDSKITADAAKTELTRTMAVMKKQVQKKADGRTIIFYSFESQPNSSIPSTFPNSGSHPEANRSKGEN